MATYRDSRMAIMSGRIEMQAHSRTHGLFCASMSKTMELRWATRSRSREKNLASITTSPATIIPVYISVNPSHTDPVELRELYRACNHSCNRFPNSDGLVDIDKLRIALRHSSVLVSVFCKPQDMITRSESTGKVIDRLIDLLHRTMPVSPLNGQLVGFGRAVSDLGLTASIYDVMVIPALRGMGIGRMIVKRITRMLTTRDIYDIAVLCSEEERLFFEACGFGDDILGSTTMMYTRTITTNPHDTELVTRAGRKLLVAPPLREYFASSKATKMHKL